jgi:hypothetical protein
MEWDKKIPSRLNRLGISITSHLTGQVGQVGQAPMKYQMDRLCSYSLSFKLILSDYIYFLDRIYWIYCPG